MSADPQPTTPAAADQVPGIELPDALSALDWHELACQSEAGCTNRATHIVHRHAVDECNNAHADPFGNFVDILCVGCVRTMRADVVRQVDRYARFPGAYCLTCGGPLDKLGHILRKVVQLRSNL